MRYIKEILILFAALFLTQLTYAQSGRWAKFDQELKDGALFREASQGNLEEVKNIVAGGGNVHYVTPQTKFTILMAAAGSGKIEVVRYLLGLGVDPSAKDWWDQTAVDRARSIGAKDIEALLQEAIAGKQNQATDKPQSVPNSGPSGRWAKYDQELKDGALYREASQGNLEEVKSIVAGGGNIHYTAPQTKFTILMAAAGSGKIEVVRYLLDLGANPAAKDWWDQTAVDKARSVGAKDIEALLLNAAAGKQTTLVVEPQPKPDKQKEDLPVVTTRPEPKIGPTTFSKWPSFGSYAVGDSVLYWVPTGWRRGIIKEVGVKEATGRISIDYSHKKYFIDPDAYALGNDWYEWSGVVKLERQPFWTGWFVGEWQIGEVQAHSNEVKAGKEIDTYYYHKATEKLQVFANNTYRWQLMDGKVVTGKWKAIPNEPGIVLQNAYRGFDWSLRNSTGVFDWQIRKLDMINLKPSANVMSINGKRKTTE